MKSVGFKEWALVCDALGRGEQRLLLRKGGIAEGRDGFGFKHQEFFLFPTYFHAQADQLRIARAALPVANAGEITIRYFVRVAQARWIDDWSELESLEPLHVLKPEVVRERFNHGDSSGLHVGWVETFRLHRAWTFPDRAAYGGCRSWVNLPDAPPLHLDPVLSV